LAKQNLPRFLAKQNLPRFKEAVEGL